MLYQQKPNGKKRLAVPMDSYIHGGMSSIRIYAIQMNVDWIVPARWEYFPEEKVLTAVWIWRETCGSGVSIGFKMIITVKAPKKIQRAPQTAPAGSSAAAVGAVTTGIAGRRSAVGLARPAAAVVWAFAWWGLCNHLPFYHFTIYHFHHRFIKSGERGGAARSEPQTASSTQKIENRAFPNNAKLSLVGNETVGSRQKK